MAKYQDKFNDIHKEIISIGNAKFKVWGWFK